MIALLLALTLQTMPAPKPVTPPPVGTTAPCKVRPLEQGGSPTAPNVRVCG